MTGVVPFSREWDEKGLFKSKYPFLRIASSVASKLRYGSLMKPRQMLVIWVFVSPFGFGVISETNCVWKNDRADSERRFQCDSGSNDWHRGTETEGHTDDRRGWWVWRVWDWCVMKISCFSFLFSLVFFLTFPPHRMGRKRRRRRGQETMGRWLGRRGVWWLCESAEVSCELNPPFFLILFMFDSQLFCTQGRTWEAEALRPFGPARSHSRQSLNNTGVCKQSIFVLLKFKYNHMGVLLFLG